MKRTVGDRLERETGNRNRWLPQPEVREGFPEEARLKEAREAKKVTAGSQAQAFSSI